MVPDTATTPLQMGGEWSYLFTMVLVVLFLSAITLVIIWNRYNRPDLDSEHAAVILSQLETFGGGQNAVVLRSEDHIQDEQKVSDIRALFTSTPEGETTVTGATSEMLGHVRAELAARKPDVSKVPRIAVHEALWTALLGAVAMVPLAYWESAASGSPVPLPGLGTVTWAGGTVLSWGHSLITAYPYLDVMFAFALTFGIIGVQWFWTLWMVPPILLITLAGTYLYLEKKVDHDRTPSGPSIRGWSTRFVGLALTIWFVGVTYAALGALIPGGFGVRFVVWLFLATLLMAVYAHHTREVPREPHYIPPELAPDRLREKLHQCVREGSELAHELETNGFQPEEHRERTLWGTISREYIPSGVKWKQTALVGLMTTGLIHPAIALVISLIIGGAVARYWLRVTLRRWKFAADRDGRDALALDVIHSVTVTVAALTLPLMVSYAVYAIGTGRILDVGRVILSGPALTVISVAFLAVMVAITIAVAYLEQFRDVRRGIRRAMDVQAVRTAVIARAFPLILTVTAAVLFLAMGFPLVMGLATAVIIGIIARLVYMAVNYITFKSSMRPERERTANRVVVNGRKITDSDGEPVYVAAVNGHRTAHRDMDRLIRQVQRDSQLLFRRGKPDKGSFARYYYKNGLLRGKVDLESVVDELLGDVRTRLKANVIQKDADAETILETLREEYPDRVVDRMVRDLKDRGILTRREDSFEWRERSSG